MLTQLRIENFKCWKDTGDIRLAPITLLFGANSSGKSSIGQFLMMLKQTVESADRRAVFHLEGGKAALQLGSYVDMVHGHNSTERIQFSYRWTLPDGLRFVDRLKRRAYRGDAVAFSADVGCGEKDEPTPILHDFQYQLLLGNVRQLAVGMQRVKGRAEYGVAAQGYALKRWAGRVWPAKATTKFYGFPDEVVAYYQNAGFVKYLNLEQEKLFRSVHYLGPLRSRAERLYSWAGMEPENVGESGENTVRALLAAQARELSLGPNRRKGPFHEIIALKLREMGLIDEFEVRRISAQRQEYEVRIRTKGSPSWVDLPDVGFGISQVLPVLVQCFYAPPHSIIIMEQPEIHLHPSAQSALADVMIDAVKSREHGRDRGIQLIIETHSEHFLRRLLRRIADNRLSEKAVSAYFANSDTTPPVLEKLDIDLFGDIKNWPKDFFGDQMGDVAQQFTSAMRKRASQQVGRPGEKLA